MKKPISNCNETAVPQPQTAKLYNFLSKKDQKVRMFIEPDYYLCNLERYGIICCKTGVSHSCETQGDGSSERESKISLSAAARADSLRAGSSYQTGVLHKVRNSCKKLSDPAHCFALAWQVVEDPKTFIRFDEQDRHFIETLAIRENQDSWYRQASHQLQNLGFEKFTDSSSVLF